jgi:hypothetical protein
MSPSPSEASGDGNGRRSRRKHSCAATRRGQRSAPSLPNQTTVKHFGGNSLLALEFFARKLFAVSIL